MITENKDQEMIPELFLSLWSIRYRMIQRPAQSLELLQRLGIKTVEVAGFFNFEAKKLHEELKNYGMKVCSVVAPPFMIGRDLNFYLSWIEKYFWIFDSDTIVLQSLPDIFEKASNNSLKVEEWSNLFIQIACELKKCGIRVSYHCFPHDFKELDNQSFLSRIFDRIDVPDNIGLQLDTYWLRIGKIEPSDYAKWPIHSFHLNERDNQGQNKIIGSDVDKCVKYIQSSVVKGSEINWILENDSSNLYANDNDGRMMNTIKDCIINWPIFWHSAKIPYIQSAPKDLSLEQFTTIDSSDIDTEDSIEDDFLESIIYKSVFDEVLTEHLFGEGQLVIIDHQYPKLKCYVDKRKLDTGIYSDISYNFERNFMSLFWPSGVSGEQIIQVIGGAGSGKSTFTRFFFQYFLPYYETLANGLLPDSIEAEIHTNSLNQHIFLYVDLRRDMKSVEMIPFLYEKLGQALIQSADQMNIDIDRVDEDKITKQWVKRQISKLAYAVQDNKRKWYISWILDNSDQMEVDAQRELVKLFFEWIPEQISTIASDEPVLYRQKRELWRIIIPMRPETLTRLSEALNPIHNRYPFYLSSIDQDILIQKRAEYLSQKILELTKNPFIDVRNNDNIFVQKKGMRPQFNMAVPEEQAIEMKQRMQIAHIGKSEMLEETGIPDQARPIFDQLASDSARRRLFLVSRIAFSRTFHLRSYQGKLSKFYFLESLIRGNNRVFDPIDRDDIVLLNLYNMGGEKKYDPFSIFVGIHSIFLLKQDMDWEDVVKSLKKIGYRKTHLKKCEEWLSAKEILKHNGHSREIETSIILGHWSILKERAYTDNMAVSCAGTWGMPEMAQPKDPLNPNTLLPRIMGSIWFINKIWEAEYALSHYQSEVDFQNRCGDFKEFSENRKRLRLPSITNLISVEYLSRLQGLYEYPQTKIVIDRERTTWNSYIITLQKLVNDSGRDNVLYPRQN